MVINRDTIRTVKSFNNERLRAWLQEYGYAMYQDGKRDALYALLKESISCLHNI